VLFDSVLLFERLYYVSISERPALFKKLFNNVVAPGGYVVFFLEYQQCLSNPANDLDHVFRGMITRLGLTPLEETDRARICEMMTSAGFQFCYDLPVECEMRVEPLDDDLFQVWYSGVKARRVSIKFAKRPEKSLATGKFCLAP